MSVPFYSGWLTPSLRRGRLSYLFASLTLSAIAGFVGALIAVGTMGQIPIAVATFFSVATVVIILSASVIVMIQRLRDAGYDYWLIGLVFGAGAADQQFGTGGIFGLVAMLALAIPPSQPNPL